MKTLGDKSYSSYKINWINIFAKKLLEACALQKLPTFFFRQKCYSFCIKYAWKFNVSLIKDVFSFKLPGPEHFWDA